VYGVSEEQAEHLVNDVGASISSVLECRQTTVMRFFCSSSDAVYLYSTHDEPDTGPVTRTPVLFPNKQTETSKLPTSVAEAQHEMNNSSMDIEMADDDIERSLWIELLGDGTDDEGEKGDSRGDLDVHSYVSVVMR